MHLVEQSPVLRPAGPLRVLIARRPGLARLRGDGFGPGAGILRWLPIPCLQWPLATRGEQKQQDYQDAKRNAEVSEHETSFSQTIAVVPALPDFAQRPMPKDDRDDSSGPQAAELDNPADERGNGERVSSPGRWRYGRTVCDHFLQCHDF